MTTSLFMGKTFDYWRTLQERVEKDNLSNLMDDFVVLNAKVRYYESFFDDIRSFRSKADKMSIYDKT